MTNMSLQRDEFSWHDKYVSTKKTECPFPCGRQTFEGSIYVGQFRQDDLLRHIAARLRAAREGLGLSQEQVYYATGIHVGRIETGRLNMTISTLEALCRYYGLSLHEFFGELEPNNGDAQAQAS